jgi:hypothetical protein
MSRRLLTALRTIAQDCETIAAAARKALREIESAELLGTPVNEATVQRHVARLERRLMTAARRVGVRP